MKKLTNLAMAASAVLLGLSGCGDSATEIIGTLPVVTGITVDTLVSMGDTIAVSWTRLDSTLVDGYFLWTRNGLEGPWDLAAATTENFGFHIASCAGYYTVTAYKGDDTSADTGIPADCRADGLMESRVEFVGRPVGYRIDIQGDSLVAGDPANGEFRQDFVVAMTAELERFIYPGYAHPEMWPGGARSRISSSGGLTAPEPASSSWRDSIRYGGNFFLALDTNYYTLLDGTSTIPDTVSMSDTLVLDGQIQKIRGVRLFNPI